MGLFENFPYTNFHELNVDMLIKALDDIKNKITGIENLNEETLSKLQPQIDELSTIIKSFDTKVVKSIVDNYVMTGIYFGLTDSGYFTASIPGAWSEIVFATTGLDIETELESEYGHLVLTY